MSPLGLNLSALDAGRAPSDPPPPVGEDDAGDHRVDAALRAQVADAIRDARRALVWLRRDAEEMAALLDQVAAARDELSARHGGGMAAMSADTRHVYDQLCYLHDQLRRARAGVGVPGALPLHRTPRGSHT